MAYVQIENPEIIDLSSIQKIINVLNDHSDYLNVLVSKFGANYIPDWLANDVQSNFDIATTNIVFGKAIIEPGSPYEQGSGNGTYYIAALDFETGVTFSEPPIVIVSHDNSDGQVGGQLDMIVSTHNISTTGFTARMVRSGTTKTINNDVHINYIAIGPR